jgi:hypothetical protein
VRVALAPATATPRQGEDERRVRLHRDQAGKDTLQDANTEFRREGAGFFEEDDQNSATLIEEKKGGHPRMVG